MKSVLRVIYALAVVLAVSLPAAAAEAAPAADSADNARQCEEMCERAMELVEVGETAKTKAERLAAYTGARDLALQVLEIEAENPDAHFIVFASEGRITLLQGAVPNPYNLYKAQGRLDHVLELDPSHPEALAAKGGLYRQLPWALGGNLDKAEDYLKRSIAANPEAIGARLELAETYRDMGKPERCPALIDKALEIALEQGKPHKIEQARRLKAEIVASK